MADFDNRNRRGGRGNDRREGRARAAEKHTAEMEARFGKEIERSLAGLKHVEGMPKTVRKPESKPVNADEAAASETDQIEETAVDAGAQGQADREASEASSTPEVPEVTVLDATATQAILDNGRGYAQFCDLTVLDFASFVNPAGNYIKGFMGQEQSLCADSFLYNVLKEQRDWYGENRRRNINCELYRNRALVVPAVRFERNHVHAYADVIVAAAPNAKRARVDYGLKDDVLLDALRDRVKFALAIADELGHEKAVLGAWGCGAFGWDAETVAEVLREELVSGEHVLKQVFLTVPSTRWDENLPKFDHVFSAYPAKCGQSYADAAAARAAAKAAADAEAAAEDDEDEDDWRKYL